MSSHESAESHYDTLDQQGEWNAAEMRAMSGYEATHDASEFTAAAIQARLGLVSLQEVEVVIPESHDGSNPKHGLNHQSWAKNTEAPEQQAQVARGLKATRANIRPTRFGK